MRDIALDHAARGFRVFPLNQGGKNPELGANWRRFATSSRDKVMDLWTDPVMAAEQPFNVGVALGPTDLVVDVDVRAGRIGARTLAMLEALYEPLPATKETRTASGGRHLWFKVPPNMTFAGKLGEHVDLKAEGGFVVADGSVVDGIAYAPAPGAPTEPAPAPEWLLGLAKRTPREKAAAAASIDELDTDANRKRAIEYLTKRAPDSGTYAVAAHVKDLGISEDLCTPLLMEHWVEPRDLGKDYDHIAFRVANAYRYGQEAVGSKSPEADFDDVSADIAERKPPATETATSAKRAPLIPGIIAASDLLRVPPRQWLYGHKLSRKYTAFVASPGGVGKTAWVTAVALACASGKKLLHDQPHHPMRVWIYNLEDDLLEMRRRILAAMRHHELPDETLTNLRINSGRDRGLKVVKLTNESLVVQPDARDLAARMLDEQIELLIVDPFLRSHGVPENASEGQDEVMRVYAEIADRTNAAIVLLHHTKKGGVAGDQESMRGSSTQGGGARSVMTLTPMPAEEATRLSVTEQHRRLYVRIDDAKNNMSAPGAVAEWIKLDSFQLDNQTPEYPHGDSVQVARAWSPPDAWVGVTQGDLEGCMARIGAGMEDGERYSLRPQDKDRWAGTVLVDELGRTDQQAKEILQQWVRAGDIEVREYASGKQRKTRRGVFLKEDGE